MRKKRRKLSMKDRDYYFTFDLKIFWLNPAKNEIEKSKRQTEEYKAVLKLSRYLTKDKIKEIIETN